VFGQDRSGLLVLFPHDLFFICVLLGLAICGMQPLTFVHAADLHLDTPFLGLEGYDAALAQALRDASLAAFDDLIALCLREKAVFLLISGDVYDGAERGVRAQLHVQKGVRRLADAGTRTFIIHGNHDPLNGWSAIREWPAEVKVFGSGDVEAIPVELDGARVATVYGISYGQPAVTENLALRYQLARVDAPGVHIAMLHGTVGAVTGHDRYAPCTLDDLLAGRMDYWALGHIHKREILRGGAPWVVYSGNLQGRSPKPAESEAKGAYVVHVVQGVIQAPRFVALDKWRFELCPMDVSDVVDMPGLKLRLEEAAQAKLELGGNRGMLLRAVLTGAGEVVHLLRRGDALNELLRVLREGRSPQLWWTGVVDEMALPHDRAALLERDDFIGAVVRQADRLTANPEMLAHLLQNMLSRRQLALVDLQSEEFAALVSEAEVLAVKHLREQEAA